MCSPDSHSPRQCLARVAEAIVKHFAADNSVCNSWTERPISKFVGLWIQVHGIADAGCKAKSSCGGVCESVLISCMSPAPMGKSDWAAPHVYLLYCARGWQSRSSLVHRTRKLATYIPTLVFFLLLRHASTIPVNPKHCPSTAYEWQSSQYVHYDSCAVPHGQDTLPCVCSLSAMSQAAAADQGSGIFRPATRLRPPSTPLQQHVRCEMVILRIPTSGDLRAVTALGCVRGCVFARNYAVVECSQSHIDCQSWRRCVGLPHDAVGSQQMVFQRHIFRGRACEDRREHCGPASGPTSKFEASTALAR